MDSHSRPTCSGPHRKILHRELVDALASKDSLAQRISDRIEAYAQLPTIPVPAPVVETFLDAATDATIVEVRSHDRPALLLESETQSQRAISISAQQL